MFTQFLTTNKEDSEDIAFIEISFIFYTLNAIVFCLALLYNERVYWELEEGLRLCDKGKVKEVNGSWVD